MATLKTSQIITASLLLLILTLTSCGGFSSRRPSVEPPQKAATATPSVVADCFQTATALAWLDEDSDGVWDETEQPLAGIEFILEPTVYSRTTSNADGVANIVATTPGLDCPEPLQVIAVDFTGYEPTTPSVVDYRSPDERYEFGFQAMSAANIVNTPTPTPQATSTPIPTPIVIETETYEGVILIVEAAAEYHAILGDESDILWRPTKAEVMELEQGLRAFLQTDDQAATSGRSPLWERLSDYKRQYYGFERAGQRLIHANFFCDDWGADWHHTPIFVLDGGDCYFQVVYNSQTNTFVSLCINGEA